MEATELLIRAGWEDHGGVLVNPAARDIPHTLRGTCEPECPMFGECHCGCGEPTTIQRRTYATKGLVRGRPATYARYHNPREVHGCYSREGVPLEKVEPFVRWLVDRYGRSHVPDLPKAVVDDILHRRRKRADAHMVGPERAQHIVGLVLAHRRPSEPWRFEAEEERRVLPRSEQLAMDRAEASSRRRAHRYARLGVVDPRDDE